MRPFKPGYLHTPSIEFFDRLENLTGDVVYTGPFKNFQPVQNSSSAV